MAFGKRSMVLVVAVAVVALMGGVEGVVYKVGDSTGWTTIGNYNYQRWSSTKTFRVGDIILFEYNTQYHNVMQVTHTQYQVCNVSAPLVTLATGNDSFPITRNGHFYFLCGVPGHCQSGQKVDIRVLAPSSMAPGGAAMSPGGSAAMSPGGSAAMSPGGSAAMSPGGSAAMSPGGGAAMSPGGSAAMSPGGAAMSPGGTAMSPGGADMSPGGSADMAPPPMNSDSTPPGPSPRNDVAHPSQGALGLATLVITAFAGFATLY